MIFSRILFHQDILLNSVIYIFYFTLVDLVELQREKEKHRELKSLQ